MRDSAYTVLQYGYLYAYNDWRSRVYGVNDHEADWEQVIIDLGPGRRRLLATWSAISTSAILVLAAFLRFAAGALLVINVRDLLRD